VLTFSRVPFFTIGFFALIASSLCGVALSKRWPDKSKDGLFENFFGEEAWEKNCQDGRCQPGNELCFAKPSWRGQANEIQIYTFIG
jgi:hypothetical protein